MSKTTPRTENKVALGIIKVARNCYISGKIVAHNTNSELSCL